MQLEEKLKTIESKIHNVKNDIKIEENLFYLGQDNLKKEIQTLSSLRIEHAKIKKEKNNNILLAAFGAVCVFTAVCLVPSMPIFATILIAFNSFNFVRCGLNIKPFNRVYKNSLKKVQEQEIVFSDLLLKQEKSVEKLARLNNNLKMLASQKVDLLTEKQNQLIEIQAKQTRNGNQTQELCR